MTTDDYERLKLRVMRHEGTGPTKNGRLLPYQDTEGVTTIGYGRNLSGRGISADEAMFFLENDLADAIADCRKLYTWFDDLDGVRQQVVAELMFNLGMSNMQDCAPTMAYVGRGEYQIAALRMLKWKWASQVGTRAIRLAKMMETGKEQV